MYQWFEFVLIQFCDVALMQVLLNLTYPIQVLRRPPWRSITRTDTCWWHYGINSMIRQKLLFPEGRQILHLIGWTLPLLALLFFSSFEFSMIVCLVSFFGFVQCFVLRFLRFAWLYCSLRWYVTYPFTPLHKALSACKSSAF